MRKVTAKYSQLQFCAGMHSNIVEGHLSLACHVQRSYYRPASEKLSHDQQMYNAELSNLQDM